MTDKQKHICFDCKYHTCEEEWHGEEEFIYSECILGHETSPIWEIKCEDFENDREHKVCKSHYILYNDDGFIDVCLCKDIKKTGFLNCPHLPNETHNCTHYVEGD